jgi:radical SAM superfamily enzyme YgiQ (UPF0313 family)
MRVLLISPNTLTEPYPVYPLGLDYVAGALAPDHLVRIADMNAVGDWDSLGEIIRVFSPEVIGISLRNIDNTDTTDPKGFVQEYQEATRVIRRNSDAILVCGGSGFTIFAEQILDALGADYGIVGEGERFALLLDAIENREDTTSIPGVITRQNRKWIPDPWNKVPVRDFHKGHSHLRFYLENGGMLNLQTKRGCNLRCIYCSYPHIEGRNLRLISPEEVAETALELQEVGAKYFFITDSVFNSDFPHSIAVARALKRAGVTIPWGAFFTPTRPPDDYFRIMADAGLTHVEFGTESLSDTMLGSYRKPFLLDHVLYAHEAAVDAGLHVAHYFLLGGPGETPDTLDETFSNAVKLQKAVLFFFCGIRIYPHTELYNIAIKEGKISESLDLLEPVFYRANSIDKDEIVSLVQNQARDRPNWVIGSGGEQTARVLSRMYEHGYSGPLWEHLIR